MSEVWTCTKLSHVSVEGAKAFQLKLCKIRDWRRPFWIYRCRWCGYFHVSTHGLPWRFINEIRETITRNDGKTARPIEKVSYWGRVCDVDTSWGTVRVLYHRKSKSIMVLGLYSKGEFFESAEIQPLQK